MEENMSDREQDHGRDDALARRAGEAFAREADALDEPTRARLAGARRAALDQLDHAPAGATLGWAPVGAAAAVALVAVGVAYQMRPATPVGDGADALAEQRALEVELLLDEDELGLYAEDADFYAWAAEATEPADAG